MMMSDARKRWIVVAVVGLGVCAFLLLHRGSPVWCQPDGHCAPTDSFASDDPIEFRSGCPKGHTMIQYGASGEYEARVYIRDPDQRPSRAFDVSFDEDAALPSDAQNTNWSSEGRQLWVSPSLRDTVGFTSIFIVYGDHVERWPWFPAGCA